MFAFDRLDAKRIAISAAGALFFSAICVGGAVAPAQATPAETPLSKWQFQATRELERAIAPLSANAAWFAVRDAKIGINISTDGHVVGGPTLIQSTGSRQVDLTLLRRAAKLKLAPIPGAQGTVPQSVELHIALIEGKQAPLPTTDPVRYAAK